MYIGVAYCSNIHIIFIAPLLDKSPGLLPGSPSGTCKP